MANQPASYVTYAGLYAMKDGGASFFLEPGPDPSTGWIVVRDADATGLAYAKDGADLIFFHEGRTKTYKHIYWTTCEDAGPGLTRINLIDSRILWKRRYITGIYNQLDVDFAFHQKTNNGKGTDGGWTFSEIVTKLTDKLKDAESGWKPSVTISDKIKNIDSSSKPILQNIHWECMPAGGALQSILNIVGGHVSIDLNGNIIVSIPEDDIVSGARGNIEAASISQSKAEAKAVVDKPDKIRFKWRILREKKFKKSYWEPLLQHDGQNAKGEDYTGTTDPKPGEWHPAADVLEDWGLDFNQIKKQWGTIEALGEDDPIKQRRYHAIQSQLYRHFRWKEPLTATDETYEHIFPFHSERGTVGDFLDGSPIYAQPYLIDAKTFTRNGTGNYIKSKVPPGMVRVDDQNTGRIQILTSNPVCDVNIADHESGHTLIESVELLDHDFSCVVAWQKKFVNSSDLGEDYYEYEVSDKWSGVEGNGQADEVLDTSQYYVERDLEGSGSYTQLNESDLKVYADLYAEDRFKQIGKRYSAGPVDIETRTYIPSVTRLDGKLLHIETGWDPSSGPFERFRFMSSAPLNPYALNYVQSYGDLRATGEAIDTSSRGLGISARRNSFGRIAVIGERAGLLGYCTDLGNRSYRDMYQIPLTWINPHNYGIICAEDRPYTDGSKTADRPRDHHTKHARITETGDQGNAEYDRVQPFDETFAHGRERWEAVLVAEDIKAGDVPPTPASQIPVQVTGPGSQYSMDASTSPHAPLTQSQPAQTTTPSPGASEKKGPKSTYVWTDTPERPDKGHKGSLRDVFRVGLHRPMGTDPDGHHINKLEIDKLTANFHSEQKPVLCGPLLDDGRKERPPARGRDLYVAQIFDPRIDGWVYYGKFDGQSMPPLPPETPSPVPTDTPPPLPPGVPTDPGGGGGGGQPGGGQPGGAQPVGGPQPGVGGGGFWVPPELAGVPGGIILGPSGTGTGGGFVPIGEGPIAGGPGSFPIPWPPIAGTWPRDPNNILNSTPRIVQPEGPGVPIPVDELMPEPFSGFTRFRGEGETENFVPAPEPRPLPAVTPLNPMNAFPSVENFYRRSPYQPGSSFGENLSHPIVAMSPYAPGSPGMSYADEQSFNLAAVAATFSWGGTAIAADQISNAQYKGSSFTSIIKDMVEAINTALGRLDELDERSRANYNVKDLVSVANGNATATITTDLAYAEAPTVMATNCNDPATWDPGNLSVHTPIQNADGTWNFTLTCENANASGGALNVALDIKGAVADSTDIDA